VLYEPWIDILVIVLLLIAGLVLLLNRRNRMLKLWSEVARLELNFHKALFETASAYAKNASLFSHYDDYDYLNRIDRVTKSSFRTLSLEERQAVFKALKTLYVSLEESDEEAAPELKRRFETLQTLRLKYNSKILQYNHFIRAFPMRLIAGRIGFEEKTYFG